MIKSIPLAKKPPMSVQDFANFGAHIIAYVKPVQVDGRKAYAVCGADGTPVCVSASEETACVAARHQDLMPLLVQ